MSDLLRWFGEQSEAVKLALIAAFAGTFGGFWAAVREWRKPVLAAPAIVTTGSAPRAHDDPDVLLLSEVSALNVGMAELISVVRHPQQNADQLERTHDILQAMAELKNEIYLLRSVLSNKTIGM